MKQLLVIILVVIQLTAYSQILPGYREYTYKQIDTITLKLFVKNPDNFNSKKQYPTIIFFFGGGWNSGNINQFKPHADYLASRGMIAVLADYRVHSRHQTTPFDAVADAKSAIRFLRQNAKKLNIDKKKIAASGGSAGGHLAAAAATVPGLNDPIDDLKVSAKPNALVLFNPVFDNGPTGYGYERIGERYAEISPMHNIGKKIPSTIVFLGTKDHLIPVETANRYKQKMELAGNRCDVFFYEDQGHSFFNYRHSSEDGNRFFIETLLQTDIFLESIGYLRGKPTIGTNLDQSKTKELIIVGTFDGGGSEGLYVFSFDRGTLSFDLLQTISDRLAPSFQAVHPKMPVVYSASRSTISEHSDHQTIGAYRANKETGMLSLINEQSVMGISPAHVSVDPLGSFVYVSNYTSGNVSMHPIRDDGGLDEASDVVQHSGSSIHPTRQQTAHAHAADPSPDGRFLYVSDLGLDKIMIYEVDRQQKVLSPASTPWFENTPGAGPRHLSFRRDGAYAYSVEELTSTIAVLSVGKHTGALRQVQRVSMLPDDFQGSSTAADIHVSPDGKFLYASNRGHDSLVIFAIDESTGELSLAGHTSTIGQHPRNFMIDESGELVFVANRDSNHIVVFRRDPVTGALNYTGTELIVPRAVCVTQIMVK